MQAYLVGYLPTGELFVRLRTVIPMVLLFALLIALPPIRLRLGRFAVSPLRRCRPWGDRWRPGRSWCW